MSCQTGVIADVWNSFSGRVQSMIGPTRLLELAEQEWLRRKVAFMAEHTNHIMRANDVGHLIELETDVWEKLNERCLWVMPPTEGEPPQVAARAVASAMATLEWVEQGTDVDYPELSAVEVFLDTHQVRQLKLL